jgi:cytochrome c peroxidase
MSTKYCSVFAIFISACAGLDAADGDSERALQAELDIYESPDLPGTDSRTNTPTSKDHQQIPNNHPFRNALGLSTTFSVAGNIDLGNSFFEDLGTNERTCGSCHKVDQGWTISAAKTHLLFNATRGNDPLFRSVDGSNSPNADVSTFRKRRAAFSMLLNRGTIRVGIGVPDGADFQLTAVDDPYGFASAAQLSLFRRPLPTTNLDFATAVMWDGRVTGASFQAALTTQANGATQGHAQRPLPLDQTTLDQIVKFEMGLFTAQIFDRKVGPLDINGGHGDAEDLAAQPIVAARWDLFDAYQNSADPKYQAIYRGQELFNTRRPSDGKGPCQGCHSQSNVGTNVKGVFFNIGTSAGARRAADQPLYTLTEISTGNVVQTTDPGRALITGKFADVGRFKAPSLRGLGARAPYFHGGSAPTLADVVAFYSEALAFAFTDDEAADLQAFLAAL